MTAADILAEARTWVDTPWRHQAACKGAGVDCLHYIAAVALAFGSPEAKQFMKRPEWHNYGRHPDPAMLFGGFDALMDRVPRVDDMRPADVLIFNCGKHPMHVGFLTECGTLLHAWLPARRVVEHQFDDAWRARVVRVYRLRGIE